MQIVPVSYSNYYSNQNRVRTAATPVNFQGGKLGFIPVATETFKTDAAKKMYPKIRRIFQMIGNSGSVKDAKILNEPTHYYSPEKHKFVDSTADVVLSISKNSGVTNMTLSRKHPDPKQSTLMLNAFFDNNGQMTKGIMPQECMTFERKGTNIRRIYCNGSLYLPDGKNEKNWIHAGGHLTPAERISDSGNNSRSGVYEMFMELARLRTSVLK